ncbi:hypothetical protein PSTT_11189 [Puccinia striiformis]|uniref:Uncharacterized protein n=1 Tax=Puccinia striiformis TaxID=27350 RepID=A0A2S4V1F2_9BASI|nr:hypothetical protein PSTT_11189 [Puccinia striiformis]
MSRINRRISVLPIPTVSNFSKRIHGMTWQAYPVGLGTATGYILLANLKTHPAFLTKIEILLFIMNIIIFSLTTGLMVVQAVLYPQQFKRVALDPNKNSFIPTCVLVFATIIVGIVNYLYGTNVFLGILINLRSYVKNFEHQQGVTVEELIIFFWIYVTFAISVAITVLTIWFSSPRNPTAAMTPAWAFPVFPLLLTGVVTFNVLRIVPLTDPRAVSIFVTGFLMFGAGAFMCIFYLAIFLLRIMTTGFLDGHQANGAFIAAGPPGFSGESQHLIHKFDHLKLNPFVHQPSYSSTWFPNPFADITQRWRDLFSGCVMVGIMLTGCSALLFTMAAIPYWTRLHKHLNEILGCWATTFPNIGLILSLKFLGDTFDSKVFYTFQTILTVMVFVVYLIVLFLTILAIWKGLILMSDDKSVYMDNIGLSEEKTDIEKGGHGSAHAPAHKH